MVIGLGAALLAAVLFGVGAVAQAVAARDHGFLSRLMVGVGALYLVGWLLHLVAIANLPLYVAQVGVAVSLVVTALIAAQAVHEPLAPRHWVAIAAMMAGLVLLVLSSGDVGTDHFSPVRTAVLYTALVLVLVLGLLVRRRRDQLGGVLLGVLAGVAYTGSPVATRSLVSPQWDLDTVAPAITIGLFGVLGFWLYSLAMRRTSVTAATAPLILLETVLPAAVGVLLFGDDVRHGWWPVALVGFALSTAGALVLCSAETRLQHLEEQVHHRTPAAQRT